jgi:tetratricopeptide (TPR) repeat protein
MLSFGLSGQTPAAWEVSTSHYQVVSELSRDSAARMGSNLEALFDLYNSYFRFDPVRLPLKLKVRILSSRERYTDYLRRFVSNARDNFTYLHYADPARCELVGYIKDDAASRLDLNHQAFIQFLRAFIPNPPLWLREGFAVFFETTVYDHSIKTIHYIENISWLDTLKELAAAKGEKFIPVREILRMTPEKVNERIDIFYPQAWGLVSFLSANQDQNYSRLLWDSVTLLQPSASLDENQALVYDRAFRWYDEKILMADFIEYIGNKKSLRSLVHRAIEKYSRNNLAEAEKDFQEAVQMDTNDFVSYYYLGLIRYAQKEYAAAESQYTTALEKGAQAALIYYAMGINALADGRSEAALEYLKKSAEADPAYKQRAEDLSRRISVPKPQTPPPAP